ncbi:AfsA-related hotdog domain-containing protein [Actinomadura roseirufa]|uniref:AfsA-related hotdog domain-containing protein n=1 Tax=Actinomadura roseirufa TaxID=2094049 RepID=UPI0010417CEB|nr:AfsA-related hotdog domain-containing protein [Actinomadura roseirufa]
MKGAHDRSFVAAVPGRGLDHMKGCRMDASVIDRFRELTVDESDPFYFDHPLDHVPGMLLFSGLFGLAADADAELLPGRAPGRVTAHLDFTRFCELDRATALSCVAGGGGTWTVAARQGEMTACAGSIAFTSGGEGPPAGRPAVPPPRSGRPAGHARLRRASGALVHRSRPENILIGEPARSGPDLVECAVLDLPEGNALRREGRPDAGRADSRATVEIVEAGRQFATMMEHREHGRPMDVTVLWLSLRMDLPRWIDRAVPLLLRWPVERLPGRRSRYAMTLVDASGGAALGSLVYGAHPVGPAAYARTRRA